ncbi:PIN domain-containing protein [Listeria rocourtiae]|uniref:PIN domain-containing protein n=1 Tax=Listeria rocourtiae TaxID=647910 RepID=UPI003D2F56E8
MIDTNYFVAQKFNTEKIILKNFKEMIDDKLGTFLFNDILIGEYKSHLDAFVDYTSAKFKNYLKDKKTLNTEIPMFEEEGLKGKVAEYENQFLLPFKQKFDTYLNDINGIDISIEQINLKVIVDKYFNSISPFEANDKKKSEFPDAIIVESIINWMSCQKNFDKAKDELYIVTKDEGLTKALHNPYIHVVEDLKECLLSLLDPELESKIEENISSDEFEIFLEKLLFENMDGHLIEGDLNFMLDSFDAEAMQYSILDLFVKDYDLLTVHKEENEIKLIIEITDVTANLNVDYSITDIDSGFYDKETGQIFGEEHFDRSIEIEADLKIIVAISVDENNIFTKRLSQTVDDIDNLQNRELKTELQNYEYKVQDVVGGLSLEIKVIDTNVDEDVYYQ